MIYEKYRNDFSVKGKRVLFNPITDRNFWGNLSPSAIKYFENELKLFDANGRGHLTASLYREFAVNGNRARYESIYFKHRAELLCKTILECIYNDDRFMTDILDLVWMILEETSWTLPAHSVEENSDSLPDFESQSLDLFLAETASVLVFVHQVIGEKLDKLSSVVSRRIKVRLQQDVIENYMFHNDKSWWTKDAGNWNVWIHSNILLVALTMEDNNENLKKIIEKIISSLDIYFDNYPKDGGCDEGTVYWNQSTLSALECLWLLNIVTDGKINCFNEEVVRNSSEYFMKMYIGKLNFVNFGDAVPNPPVFFASLFKFSEILNNKDIADFAKETFESLKDTEHFKPYDLIQKYGGYDKLTKTFRLFDMCKYLNAIESYSSKDNNISHDYFVPSVEVMTARSKNNGGLFIGAKGGKNDEHHNHNDIGNFVVYKDGVPFIIDAGNMTYSKATFSSDRYKIWTTQSSYHNLPKINGFDQKMGSEYASKDAYCKISDNNTLFSLDLKNAYENKNQVIKWVRKFEFDKLRNEITVVEDFAFDEEYEYSLNFITNQNVICGDKTITLTSADNVTLSVIFADFFEVDIEKIECDDPIIKSSWGDNLSRIILFDKSKVKTITYKIR